MIRWYWKNLSPIIWRRKNATSARRCGNGGPSGEPANSHPGYPAPLKRTGSDPSSTLGGCGQSGPAPAALSAVQFDANQWLAFPSHRRSLSASSSFTSSHFRPTSLFFAGSQQIYLRPSNVSPFSKKKSDPASFSILYNAVFLRIQIHIISTQHFSISNPQRNCIFLNSTKVEKYAINGKMIDKCDMFDWSSLNS